MVYTGGVSPKPTLVVAQPIITTSDLSAADTATLYIYIYMGFVNLMNPQQLFSFPACDLSLGRKKLLKISKWQYVLHFPYCCLMSVSFIAKSIIIRNGKR